MTKKWYASKTIWVNVAAIVAGLITNQNTEWIQPYLQVGILALINVGLRAITNQKIKF